jgi:hypothetical protein
VPELTVYIPAYRSEATIGQTLSSVRDQTYTDFEVEIAIEPDGAEAVVAACQPFLADRRFRYLINDQTLGWDGNVRACMARVETPLFAMLPHDDLWHRAYLETLVGSLRDRPDAVIGHADQFVLGMFSGIQKLPLPDDHLAARLLAWFLRGTDGSLWHAVTRREALTREFPCNEFQGFACEGEWSLHLLTVGPTLYVPRPLYLKRVHNEGVSGGWRERMPEAVLRAALDHSWARIAEGIPTDGLSTLDCHQLRLAAQASHLRRWVRFGKGRFVMTADERAGADRLLEEASDRALPAGPRILARALVAWSRYCRGQGDRESAERHCRAAVEADPEHWEGWLELGWLRLDAGRPDEALDMVLLATQLSPMENGLAHLQAECSRRITGS